MALVLRQLLATVPAELDLVNRKNQHGWAPLHMLASGGRETEVCVRVGEHITTKQTPPQGFRFRVEG